MTQTTSAPDTQAESARLPRPHTDAAALRGIQDATKHVRGTSMLDKIAAGVNRFCNANRSRAAS